MLNSIDKATTILARVALIGYKAFTQDLTVMASHAKHWHRSSAASARCIDESVGRAFGKARN
jgi:hypothetical protein